MKNSRKERIKYITPYIMLFILVLGSLTYAYIRYFNNETDPNLTQELTYEETDRVLFLKSLDELLQSPSTYDEFLDKVKGREVYLHKLHGKGLYNNIFQRKHLATGVNLILEDTTRNFCPILIELCQKYKKENNIR